MATSVRSFVGDLEIIDSLDAEASKRQFRGLPKSKPTLEAALEAAGIQNVKSVLSDAMEFANLAREDPEIASLGLTDDEAGAISCYTLEVNGGNSPYKIINQGLAGSRNRATLSSTRKLIFLLLSGLRKLPRFRPSRGQMLYRGIRRKVPITQGEANGHQFYEKGRTVTWWGFTSTTTSLGVTQSFISGTASTLFKIGGENLWGYDIKAFSQFSDEEEILLEPEAKMKVERVDCTGGSLMINVTLQKFDHLVLGDIISAGKVAEKKWECAWKECPEYVNWVRKYSVDKKNPRIATFIGSVYFCTAIGNTPLPLNKVTSWSVKILKSAIGNGRGICIGVSPSDINQNEGWDNSEKCGWYFHSGLSILRSGPPHNYSYPGNEYGPWKEWGEYDQTGDNVGVVMDTTKGELSFVVNGVNLGVAYEGIPLEKPLVPCVILGYPGDSVELVI